MKMKKLGVPCTDSKTGLKGAIVNTQIQEDKAAWYLFQPGGLDKKTGQPHHPDWVTGSRLDAPEVEIPDPPYEILGTMTKDRISGFEGNIVDITIFLTGCVHITLQPPGKDPETGGKKKPCNFDITRCDGPALKELRKREEAEAKAAQAANPTAPVKVKPPGGPFDHSTPRREVRYNDLD